MIDPHDALCNTLKTLDSVRKENTKLKEEIERLREAIIKTLEDNAHLADGDNCTLIGLKQALKNTGK